VTGVAARQRRSLLEEFDHAWEQVRRILQVRVHDDHSISSGEIEARADCGLVTEITRKSDYLDASVVLCELKELSTWTRLGSRHPQTPLRSQY